MNCFNGYIGLRGCSEGTPASGLYINQLPGLPSELFSQIANNDQATFRNVWLDVQSTAQAQLLTDSRKEFGKRYKMRSILRKIDIGKNIDISDITTSNSNYQGFLFDADFGVENGYTNSHLMGFPVEYMELYVPATFTGDLVVKILDADTSEELFSDTINTTGDELVAGWNTIPVNTIFTAKRLFFCFDGSQFDAIALTPLSAATDTLCDCLEDLYGFTNESCPGKISGAISGGLAPLAITEGESTFGLTAKIGITCSLESFLCENKTVFARALWYLEGHHALWHAVNSPAFSRYNTVDRKFTDQLMSDYLAMYQTELEMVVSGINLNESDLCLECDAVVQKRYVFP